jgi:hypothetical protein
MRISGSGFQVALVAIMLAGIAALGCVSASAVAAGDPTIAAAGD